MRSSTISAEFLTIAFVVSVGGLSTPMKKASLTELIDISAIKIDCEKNELLKTNTEVNKISFRILVSDFEMQKYSG